MGRFKDLAIIAEDYKPRTVNHENIQLYAALKETLALNEELRKALLVAAETIHNLTEALNESQTSSCNTKCS